MEKEQFILVIVAIIAVVAIVFMTMGMGINGLAAAERKQPPIPIQLNILFDDGAVSHAGTVYADSKQSLKLGATTNMDNAVREIEFLAWHRETGCIREVAIDTEKPFEATWNLQQLDCGKGVYHIIVTATHASTAQVSRRASIIVA